MRESSILREVMLALGAGPVRACPRCGETKPIEAFAAGSSGGRKDGTHTYCRECMNAYKRERYQREREKEVRRAADYAKRNPEKVAARRRMQRRARPEHYRNWRRQYQQANRERLAVHDANKRSKRRARVKGSPGVTPAQWAEIKRRCRHRCVYCGQKRRLTMDHVVPLARGGLHEPANVLPACVSCNSSKCATDPVVYANRIGRLL